MNFNGKHAQKTHSTKMHADKSAENTQKCPKNCLPNLSAEAQKFGISMKKSFIGHPYSVGNIKTVKSSLSQLDKVLFEVPNHRFRWLIALNKQSIKNKLGLFIFM